MDYVHLMYLKMTLKPELEIPRGFPLMHVLKAGHYQVEILKFATHIVIKTD